MPNAANRITITPAHAPLAFSIAVPTDFHQLPLPQEEHDFSNPTVMMPLAVFMAGYGAVLCSIAVRPIATGPAGETFGDGTVMTWVTHLATQQEGSRVRKLMPGRKWGTSIVECEALQPSDAGEMIVSALFFEDGGNLFNVAMMAPAAIWSSVSATLQAMVDSFALLQPRGPTRPLSAGQPLPPKASFPVEAASEPVPAATASAPAAPSDAAPSDDLPNLAAFALDDADALNPENQINQRFRDNGADLVPRILRQSPANSCIVVGAGALSGMLPVPAGWHVVDDGRRTLVFDSGNNVQINFNLFAIENRTPSDLFTAVLQDLAQSNPNVEHRTFEAQGMNIMQVRNLNIDGESLEQCYLLKRLGEEVGLKIRVTSASQNMARALDMACEMAGGLRPLAQS